MTPHPTPRNTRASTRVRHLRAADQHDPDWDASLRYWQAQSADQPPMTAEEIATVATIFDRNDQKHANREHEHTQPDAA